MTNNKLDELKANNLLPKRLNKNDLDSAKTETCAWCNREHNILNCDANDIDDYFGTLNVTVGMIEQEKLKQFKLGQDTPRKCECCGKNEHITSTTCEFCLAEGDGRLRELVENQVRSQTIADVEKLDITTEKAVVKDLNGEQYLLIPKKKFEELKSKLGETK